VVDNMTMEVNRRFSFGLDLIREAGDLALQFFEARGSLTVRNKGPQDLASEADLQVELLIRDKLAKAFPADAFLGEETAPTDYSEGQGIWVVDPIDGTQPFICGLSSWCVSAAFVQGGRLQFGLVNAPARAELFAGGRLFPATLNGTKLHVSTATSIRNGLTGAGFSPKSGPDQFLKPFERFLKRGGMFYRDGSGALGLAYVGAGRLVGFFEPAIRSWDCLGGIGVIEGAGLTTSAFLNGDGLFKGSPIIAGSAQVCAELKEIVGGDWPGLELTWDPRDPAPGMCGGG
jgi:myo-inositol-1(or 4)-monophosphatase